MLLFGQLKQYLQENPQTGIASGGGAFGIKWISSLMTIEGLMQIVGLIGATAGAGVALLTLVLKGMELYEKLKKHRRTRRK
jgi:hypothetical protein